MVRKGEVGGGAAGGQCHNDGDQERKHVLDSNRNQATGDGGGEMQESFLEEELMQKQGRPGENLMPVWAPFPEEKSFKDPLYKKLWVAGRAIEDREEWME